MEKFKEPLRKTLAILKRIVTKILLTLGIASSVAIGLAFTDYPFWIYHWLGTSKSNHQCKPDYIVVMGGEGIPGPHALMRCYYAAQAGQSFPKATIVVALPAPDSCMEGSAHSSMINEIMIRGIDSTRFLSETNGINTHTQVEAIAGMLPNSQPGILVVTSPEYMLRTILAFRKQGFDNVGGLASFESHFEDELITKMERSKIAINQQVSFRYNLWNYLQYQIIIVREFIAIAYYWVMGYI